MSITKPKIYISSTIYDFRDLRSALKYFLEQLGYEVLLSEFNDFIKPLDENSYTACLRAVEQSNYFILLVGTRVGGFYDKSEKVSITREEYRKAYELVQLGKMKVITFVRADLWSVREDRKALEEYLREDFRKRKDLDEEDILSTSRYPSTIVNDAKATFDFLNEVGRVSEMKQAIAGKGVFPIGNWIHSFDSFHEIIETLQTVFEMSRSLNTVALITNLKRELLSNLAELTSKDKEGTVHLDARFADFARKNFKGNLMDTTNLSSKYVRWLVLYLVTVTNGNKDKISTQFVDQALTTGHFLEYDFKTNTYEIGSLHNALFLLKENINKFKNMENDNYRKELFSFVTKYCPKNDHRMIHDDKTISIPNLELIAPFAIYDCQRNITDLCIALLKAIDSDDTSHLLNIKTRPSMPLAEEAEKISSENPTIEDIKIWVDSL